MYSIEEDMRAHYKCGRCYTSCPTQKIYDLHMAMCKFIHNSQYENSIDRYYTDMETPTPTAQFQYIIHLTQKVQDLEQKMAKLQQSVLPLCRRQVGEYLESLPPPPKSFQDWIPAIEVSTESLEEILKHDLKTGVKHTLESIMDDSDSPIRAFTQKPNKFYLYDKEAEWRLMTAEEFVKFIGRLEHKFLRKYMEWTIDHSDDLTQTLHGEEKSILYMAKVNGVKQGSLENRASDIKKWLFSKIAVSLKQVVV
jgi:hypothetical protein